MLKKVLICLIPIALFCTLVPSKAFGAQQIISDAKAFIAQGQQGAQELNIGTMTIQVQTLLAIALDIGMAVAVGAGIYLGFKVMMASADDKANAKEQLIAYVIGCAVLFGVVAIWRTTVNLFAGF